MKVKAAKNQKKSAKKVMDIKKSKKGIQKAKKPKKELKAAAAKAVSSSVAAPLTFAEKKVLSVKRKAKAGKAAPDAKAFNETSSLKQDSRKKTKLAPEPVTEVLPPLKNPAKSDKTVANSGKLSGEKSALKKKKKKQNENLDQTPVKPREVGPVATEVTEETLALVPKQLFTAKNFKVVFEFMKKKAAAEEKNRLFGDDLKYALQITAVKIPQWPSRNARVTLPYSLLRKEDDACLIVNDMKRGRKFDPEDTLNHWEDKLRELGVTGVTQIIPFQQLKRDYREFNMKLKLVHRFDRFMADARIVGHVFAFLGKTFRVRGKNPIPVKLEKDETVKESIEKALRTETYRLTNTGQTSEIKFAAHWMPVEKAVANGVALMEALKEAHPGGWLNIQSLHLTSVCNHKQSFPLYMSKIDPNAVPVPTKVGPREEFIEKQNVKIRKSTGGKYEVTADGLLKKVYGAAVMEPVNPQPVASDGAMDTEEDPSANVEDVKDNVEDDDDEDGDDVGEDADEDDEGDQEASSEEEEL